MGTTRGLAVALVVGVLLPVQSLAADRPIDARKLVVKRTASGGEKLVFANTSADDLRADQFDLSIDKSNMTQSFFDNFSTLWLHNGKSGIWEGKFPWAPESGGTLHTNGELQWYVNPAYGPTKSLNPFSVQNGILTITAGLLVVAAVVGWVVGAVFTIALGPTPAGGRTIRRSLAAVIALLGVALGQVGLWLIAREEGGTLAIGDYLAEVFGLLVPAELAIAAVVAWWRAR